MEKFKYQQAKSHSRRSFFILSYSSLLISPRAYLFFSMSKGVSFFKSVEARPLLRFWIDLKIHISIAIRRTVQKTIMRNPPSDHIWSEIMGDKERSLTNKNRMLDG